MTITIGDRTQTVKQWCEEYGMNYETVRGRIRRGWTAERALTEPIQTKDDTPIEINGTTYSTAKEACEALNVKYGTVAGYAYKNNMTLLEALQHYCTEGMKTKTAEELETADTLPLYRVESKNRHTQWHCKCKLCGAEADLYTKRIKTHRCNCRLKTYAPKHEDKANKARQRIRVRDNRRLQRAGLIPQGMVIHHLYMLRCNHATTEAILDGVMILTPEQHEQWHKEHPKYEVPIYPELD